MVDGFLSFLHLLSVFSGAHAREPFENNIEVICVRIAYEIRNLEYGVACLDQKLGGNLDACFDQILDGRNIKFFLK